RQRDRSYRAAASVPRFSCARYDRASAILGAMSPNPAMPSPRQPSTHRFRVALIAAVLLMLSAGIGVAAPAGSVVGLSGTCFVESGGQRAPLRIGRQVQGADTVDVPAAGKLKLRMTDGSVIAVGAGSRVTVSAYATDAGGKR